MSESSLDLDPPHHREKATPTVSLSDAGREQDNAQRTSNNYNEVTIWGDEESLLTLETYATAESTTLAVSSMEKIKDEAKTPDITITEIPQVNKHGLVIYGDLPKWYQDNPSILSSYRPENNSWKTSLRSLKYLHNETINIYSHLLPGIILLFLEILFAVWIHGKYPEAELGDKLSFAVFLLTATLCLFFSASYHTVMCHSSRVNDIGLYLDYLGIIVLTEGLFVSAIWFFFRCRSVERTIYWSTSVGLGVVSIIVLFNPHFRGLKWRTFRMSTFILTGSSGIAPVIHGYILFGGSEMVKLSVVYYFVEALVFVAGVIFYATRMPEASKRFKPGRFDVYGSSHQIFHFLVVLAVIMHLIGLVSAFKYRVGEGACPETHG